MDRRRISRALAALLLAGSVLAACGGDDDDTGIDPGAGEVEDDAADAEADADGGDDADEGDDGGDSGAFDGETATLRMINLVGAAEGGIDVDVLGPGEDITTDHVYATVAFGEVAEIEFPSQWDAHLVKAGTDEEVSGVQTVHDDTDPGQVVVFRDSGATTLGAFPEHRKDGYAAVGIASAIADADEHRTWRWASEDGACLFSVGNEVPAPMATSADGGETTGILSLQLVDDFVWYVEPGPQTITFADSAADVFEQGDDCSKTAFTVDIDAEEGKAVFVAVYGSSDDVQSTVYYEGEAP